MAANSETAGGMPEANLARQVEPLQTHANWVQTLRAATAEVFSMMVGVEVVVPETSDCPVHSYVTGVLGITGAVNAVLTLRCSQQSAGKIASRMLGISAEEAMEHQCDAIGEICNMIAGHFKHKIGLSDKCALTIPSVVTGGNYHIHSLAAGERFEFPALYDGDPLWLALETRK